MSNVIFYDCTRLLERRNALTPTGIDRVDIHYLNYLFKTNPEKIVGLVQYGQRVVALNHDDLSMLRNTLVLRWISEAKVNVPDRKELDLAYEAGKKLAQSLEIIDKGMLIHPNIYSVLIKKKIDNSIYINSSHLGLDKEALMMSIKTHLKSKMLFFIHDIIPIDYPEYVAANGDTIHKKRINNVSMFADRIIVNSKYTKDRVVSYLESIEYRVPEIDIIYIGADPHFKNIDNIEKSPLDGKK